MTSNFTAPSQNFLVDTNLTHFLAYQNDAFSLLGYDAVLDAKHISSDSSSRLVRF